ncbi:MAG: S9 family peptidase [Acidimicrobiales bacterium]
MTDQPPHLDRRPSVRARHGEEVEDPYAWVVRADEDELVPHLEAENAWTAHATADQEGLRLAVFDEIKRRTLEDDRSVPVRDGAWWYHQRTEEGKPYPIHCRRPDDGTGTTWVDGPEQVVLDPNELAAEGEYLGIGVLDVSPDGCWLAYAIDHEGDERHELRFRDLRDGSEAPEAIEGASYGFAWAADSRTCWYTLQDEASRPHEVWRHEVGTDPGDDVRVHHEPDERFHVSVGASRSGDLAVISAGSAVTSESLLLDARRPATPPSMVCPREQGVEYGVAHHPTGLYVTSNHDGAEDFALWRAPLDGTAVAPRDRWELVLPHQPGRRIAGVEAFAGHLVVHGRSDGRTAIWLLAPAGGDLEPLETDDPVATIEPGANPSFDASTYRFAQQSLATPPAVIDLDLATGVRTVRKQLPVLDGFDPQRYRTAREWAVSDDGTQVPISLVWRPDAVPANGPAPCVLYGYGAYEISMDPWFSIARLSLLDRGVVFALAHVRGGGELGRRWYEDGKFGAKSHSFSDFVACARHLVETGRTAPDLLAARGGSAGGLLVGAVANLAPDLFRAVVAEVPFVDPLNTMLDPSLPLTVIEREEWGDPIADAEAYGWIRAYSPYENVRPASDVAYPAILATAGLNDPRVGVHEPTKWVAHLRDLGHGASADADRPVLLKVELGAGHGGPTGRYDAWRDEAFVLAWLLAELGVS